MGTWKFPWLKNSSWNIFSNVSGKSPIVGSFHRKESVSSEPVSYRPFFEGGSQISNGRRLCRRQHHYIIIYIYVYIAIDNYNILQQWRQFIGLLGTSSVEPKSFSMCRFQPLDVGHTLTHPQNIQCSSRQR